MVAKTGAVHGKHKPSAAQSVEWMHDAACKGAGTNLFFGPDGERSAVAAVREEFAKAFCLTHCPVVIECRMWAIHTGSVGVWGGMTYEERRGERRRIRRRDSAGAS